MNKLLRKFPLEEDFEPAEKSLDEVLNNDTCFGIYRIVKPADSEYQQLHIQSRIQSHEIKEGETVRIPLAAFQDNFLKFPRMTDAVNGKDYEIDTKKKLIIPTNTFPGRCFGGHVDTNLYYFHGSFQDFISVLNESGYKNKEDFSLRVDGE